MKYICPKCRTVLTVADSMAGLSGMCAACSSRLTLPATPTSPGVVIADYVIVSALPAPSGLQMFLCHQLSLDRDVALKVFPAHASEEQAQANLFFQGARTISQLSHPSIVQVYAVGTEGSHCYLAEEYIQGNSLQAILEKEDTLPLDRAVHVAIQVAEALEFAWRKRQLLHLDLSLDKVFLADDDTVKVVDIGLTPLRRSHSANRQVPSEEALLGSPEFLAPEVILGKPTDHRTDLYSVGILLFRMLTGRFPYEGGDPLEIASRHLSQDPLSARSIDPEIPVRLSAAVDKLLAKYPSDRFQSGIESAAALRDCLRRYSPGGEDGAPAGRKSQWKCPLCGDLNADNDRFCSACGTEGVEQCPVCNADVRIAAPFCAKCGTNVSAKRRDLQRTAEALLQQLHEALQKSRFQHAVDAAKLIGELGTDNLEPAQDKAYHDVLVTLRKALETQLEQARNNQRLDEYQVTVRCLTDLFGAKAYAWHSEELQKTKSNLASRISLAGAALSSNCLVHCRRLLADTPDWTGGELGSRRLELTEHCDRLIAEREAAIRHGSAVAETFSDMNAVRALGELSRFRLSQRLTVVTPDAEDTAADAAIKQQISDLIRRLAATTETFIADAKWPAVMRLLTEIQTMGGSANEEAATTLQEIIRYEVKRRYKEATSLEDKREGAAAEDAWRALLAIPHQLLPPKVRLQAADFPNRRLKALRARRQRLLNGHLILFFFLWCFAAAFPAADLVQAFLAEELTRSDALHAILPLLGQFLVFLVFWSFTVRPRRLSDTDLLPRRQGAWFDVLLGVCWILSPLSHVMYAVHRVLVLHLQPEGAWEQAWVPAAIAGVLWLIGDALRRHAFQRLPALLSLSSTWVVAWLLLRQVQTPFPEVLPALLSAVHCLGYIVLHLFHHAIHRVLGRTRHSDCATPHRPPEPISSESAASATLKA